MLLTFDLRDRGVSDTKQAPRRKYTIATYENGVVYLDLPPADKRSAVVIVKGERPFCGTIIKIQPYGSSDLEQPHLRLVVEGDYYRREIS